MRQLPQPETHALGLDEPLLGGLHRLLCAHVQHGHLDRLENFLTMGWSTRECDVLVIGAGGAGLRAAVEASAHGASVTVLSKSLLGKAHTVMAEGGMAASMGHVDDRDNWKVHFSDTMRGGQYLNNWRMAELHAQQAPDRVRELESWGASVRPHHRRPHPATQLRRAQIPPTGPRRRPHRPGNDPHAAGPRHSPGDRLPTWKPLWSGCSRTAIASSAPSPTTAKRGRFHVIHANAVILATGGIGRAFRVTSNSWEYTGDGHALALQAGRRTHRHGVRPVPPHGHGLATERPRHSRDRGRARRRWHPHEQRRQTLHVR